MGSEPIRIAGSGYIALDVEEILSAKDQACQRTVRATRFDDLQMAEESTAWIVHRVFSQKMKSANSLLHPW